MNKKQAQEAYLGSIELQFACRKLEQEFENGVFVDINCEWIIDYRHSWYEKEVGNIYYEIDRLAAKEFHRLFGHYAEYSTLGGWWSFETNTPMGVTKAVERIRRSYKRAIESLSWCKKHQKFNMEDYCMMCDDEEFQAEQELERMHNEAKKQIELFAA